MKSAWLAWIVLAGQIAAPGSAAIEATPENAALKVLLDGVQAVLDGVDDSAAPAQPEAPPAVVFLDVEQCVAIALEQNAQALAADEAVKAAEARTGQAASRRLPQLKTQAAYNYISGLDREVKIKGPLSWLIDANDIGPNPHSITAEIRAEQVLYAGGRIQAAVRASRHLAQSEAWKREARLDQIEFEAKQAFYDALLAKALVEVARDSVATFEQHKADVAQMLEVGLVSRFELLRAETELGARQTELVSAQSAAQIAHLNLLRILAMPQNTPVELGGALEWTPPTDTLEALIDEALARRAELHALDMGIAAARNHLEASKGGYKPSAAATAGYKYIEGGGAIAADGFIVGVGLEWDIYAGGRRRHERLEARAQLKQLEREREDVARLVEMDVRQAYLRVQEAIAKIRREKGTVALAQEGLRLAQLRFQEGVGTQTETLDADLALRVARTTLAQALRDYAVAVAALDKAAGRRWTPRETPDNERRNCPSCKIWSRP